MKQSSKKKIIRLKRIKTERNYNDNDDKDEPKGKKNGKKLRHDHSKQDLRKSKEPATKKRGKNGDTKIINSKKDGSNKDKAPVIKSMKKNKKRVRRRRKKEKRCNKKRMTAKNAEKKNKNDNKKKLIQRKIIKKRRKVNPPAPALEVLAKVVVEVALAVIVKVKAVNKVLPYLRIKLLGMKMKL